MTIGSPIPAFSLPGVDGATYSRDSFADAKVLVVVQMCNHCPYVVAYQDRMNELARQTADQGVAFVAINSNDPVKYPQDSFAGMQRRAAEAAIPFPYLHDADQSVALAFGAQRTPEFFVFDQARVLVYHGRLDDNLEEPDQVQATYLADAIAAALAGQPPVVATTQPVGCTVKWIE